MTKNKELFEYNSKIFKQLKTKYPLLQLGFFNDNNILFIGQNPGTPFNAVSKQIEKEHTSNKTFAEYEKIYEENIKKCRIGTVIAKIINNKYYKISLTNIVKIPTVNNDVPSQYDIDEFMPILQMQIELLQPKLIICLGKFAGKQFELDKYYVIKLYNKSLITLFYHPSYILRAGLSQETTVMNDFINKTLKQHAIKK